MSNCIIHPIPLFKTKGDKARILYQFRSGQESLDLVNYVWYIEGTTEKILVEAGGSVDYYSKVRGVATENIQTLDSGLNKFGLSVDDINLVILTHLDGDHVGQASRFSKARFLVQREELEAAQKPHPLFAWRYSHGFFRGLNFETVSGDTKICEEISLISTPGHSPGGQSVAIKTIHGTVIISGVCSVKENFEPPPSVNSTSITSVVSPSMGVVEAYDKLVGSISSMSVVPPVIHTNVLDAYDSLVKIKKMGDIVVPAHDVEYVGKVSIP